MSIYIIYQYINKRLHITETISHKVQQMINSHQCMCTYSPHVKWPKHNEFTCIHDDTSTTNSHIYVLHDTCHRTQARHYKSNDHKQRTSSSRTCQGLPPRASSLHNKEKEPFSIGNCSSSKFCKANCPSIASMLKFAWN
jgi:hypothetical protein